MWVCSLFRSVAWSERERERERETKREDESGSSGCLFVCWCVCDWRNENFMVRSISTVRHFRQKRLWRSQPYHRKQSLPMKNRCTLHYCKLQFNLKVSIKRKVSKKLFEWELVLWKKIEPNSILTICWFAITNCFLILFFRWFHIWYTVCFSIDIIIIMLNLRSLEKYIDSYKHYLLSFLIRVSPLA